MKSDNATIRLNFPVCVIPPYTYIQMGINRVLVIGKSA